MLRRRGDAEQHDGRADAGAAARGEAQRDGGADVLRLDWRVEWVTAASGSNAARAVAGREPMPVLPGLFAAAKDEALVRC